MFQHPREEGIATSYLEHLNGIKKTKVRKKQKYNFESWVYRKILVVYVDPKHTSITCSRCYHVNKQNRNGKLFRCRACGFTLNANLIVREILFVSSAMCGILHI